MADQHKPRIVAMIPKKMQVVEVDESEETQVAFDHKNQTNDVYDNVQQVGLGQLGEVEHARFQTTPDSNDHALAHAKSKHVSSNQNSSFVLLNHSHTRTQVACNNHNNNTGNTITNTVNQSEENKIQARDRNENELTKQKQDRLCQLRKEYSYDKDEFHYGLVGLCRDIRSAKKNMATLSPKSPKAAVSKNDKEESIWDKLGTLGRKKRIKEVQEVQEEGKHAIDSPGLPNFPTTSPEDYDLEENEERCMIDQSTYTNALFIKLVKVLIDWINDELASQRIIVQDLAEDLYDGQVLQKLLEKLTGENLRAREVTQSEEGQKQKLQAVLSHFNHVLGLTRTGSKKWNVEAIHSKNIVSIMHLLVALARHFRPPVRLTENVHVLVVIVRKVNGKLEHRTVDEIITTSYDDVGMRCERDAIDTLFDHAPNKLIVVKKSLVTFVNKHLNKINLEVTELETQFHDGVYLTFLMGLLEGFFVPLHSFYSTPKDFDQKVHNVGFAFELMEEVGITKLKARPEDIVNRDLKSTLRVLYTLFTKYKNL